MVEAGEVQKQLESIILSFLLVVICFIASSPEQVRANSYDGHDLAVAILANTSELISSSYWDTDTAGHRQSAVLSSRGNLIPTDGNSFAILSTGRADLLVATSNGLNPGNERGNWFLGGQYGNPRDEANLQLQLLVPEFQHFLYYDVQFFTVEYPEYVGTQYNDQLTISVNSPSKGVTTYSINVNSGDFVFNARDAPLLGTGYNLFAQSDNPDGVDWLQTTPNTHGADAGATALVGREHPVSPGEVVTITFDLKDVGDNQFDSMAFLDNLHFSGYAKAQILARKTVTDLNGGLVQCGDILKYDLTLSNIGTANQNDNPGHEFEDAIPQNVQYIAGSITASSGTIDYDPVMNAIVWDGVINSQSSVALSFKVTVNQGLVNDTKISNQGIVHWDENEDHINEKNELTDDPTVNDGIDQDGDGETGDDDPTVVTVWSYEAPTALTETFADADDIIGGKAMDSYQGQVWFDTSQHSGQCNFEVAPNYFFLSPHSFKTKLRASGGIQYWNYSFAIFQCNPIAWECWFACGDSSEYADLNLTFKTSSGAEITKINFKYVHVDNAFFSSSYQIQLSYHTPTGWVQLFSTDPNGYLRNGWYKLRIEKAVDNTLTYSLEEKGRGVVDTSTDPVVSAPLSNLARVEWRSTQEPVVCPIFFWDEHTVELLPIL
jgi:uncharacterized repeat protein (TIGR01451 family)